MASFGVALAEQKTAKRDHRDVKVVLDAKVAERVEAIDKRIDELDLEREQLVASIDAERAQLATQKRFADPREKELDEREDAELGRIRERIDELLAEREQATEGTLWTLRFTQLPGQAWSELGYRNPPRLDVAIDRRWGYNYHETCKAAAAYRDEQGNVYGVAVSHAPLPDDAPEGAEPEEVLEELSPEQWADLWVTLSGHFFERIIGAIWDLNEYGQARKVDTAGKA